MIYAPVLEGPDGSTVTVRYSSPPQQLLTSANIHAELNHETRHLWHWTIYFWFGGNWQISGMRMGCGKYLRQRGSSESQKVIPVSCKVSNKNNLEAGYKVVWPHCSWDPTWTYRPINQHCVSRPVENLKAWTTVHTCFTCFCHTWALLKPARPQGYCLVWGGFLSCPKYRIQAKITSRWGPLESLGVLILTYLLVL